MQNPQRKSFNHEAHEAQEGHQATKATKKTERATPAERATRRKSASQTQTQTQTQTRYCQGVCVCETLFVSLGAGCAGRRRARLSAGFPVSAVERLLFRVFVVFVFS